MASSPGAADVGGRRRRRGASPARSASACQPARGPRRRRGRRGAGNSGCTGSVSPAASRVTANGKNSPAGSSCSRPVRRPRRAERRGGPGSGTRVVAPRDHREHLPQHGRGLLGVVPADVEVGDHPERASGRRRRPARPPRGRAATTPARRAVDHDDVGVDRGRVDAARLGEQPGVRVVVGEPLDVVVERVQPGRGEDADLPHPAAHPLAPDPGLGDRRRRCPTHQRADRRAEPLGQADRQHVGTAPYSASGMPVATWAFQIRAPSRCTPTPALVGELAQRRAGPRSGGPRRRRSCGCSRPRSPRSARRTGPCRGRTSPRSRAGRPAARVDPGAHGQAGERAVRAELGAGDVRARPRRAPPGRPRPGRGPRARWPSSRSG